MYKSDYGYGVCGNVGLCAQSLVVPDEILQPLLHLHCGWRKSRKKNILNSHLQIGKTAAANLWEISPCTGCSSWQSHCPCELATGLVRRVTSTSASWPATSDPGSRKCDLDLPSRTSGDLRTLGRSLPRCQTYFLQRKHLLTITMPCLHFRKRRHDQFPGLLIEIRQTDDSF